LPLIKDLINFFWFIFKWGIVPGTIVALVVVLYLGPCVDTEICCQVERRFAAHYPGLKVTAGSAVRVEGKGIEIRDLSIREPGAEGSDGAMLHVEQIVLRCDAGLVDLIGEGVCVTHVTIRHPTLRLTRLADGTWRGGQLWPPPKFSDVPPNMTIEGGTVELIDRSKQPASTLVLREINLSIENRPPAGGAPSGPPIRVLRGTATGNHVGKIAIEGLGDLDRTNWQVAGTIHDLDVSPELRAALPAPLAEQLASLVDFRGRVQLNFGARADAVAPCGCRFRMTGQIADGRLDDARLPYPWTNVRGTIHVDNEGVSAENLIAQADRATLWVARGQCGFGRDAAWSAQAKVTQLTLDKRFRAALSESMKATWDKYRPAGEIDQITAQLCGAGGKPDWARSKVTVDCKDVAFVYHKFPYPLDHGRGRLMLDGDVLSINLVAQSGNRPIEFSGQVRQPLVAPYGWFEAKGQNLPIDERLRAALLNEKTQNVFRSLAPSGWCDFWFRASRDRPTDKFSRQIVLDLKNGAICFKHFLYPLERIHGRLERLADGTWEFHDLVGTNDTAQVRCSGRLADGPAGKRLALVLVGKNVPLDKELHDALKPSMQQAWDNLEPRGMIDLETNVGWLVESNQLDLVVVARPQPGTASIKPKMFPYHMEQVGGTLVYRDGQVTLDTFHAVHGRTEIFGRGHWNFLPEGSWDFHLEDASVDRLDVNDRELVQALPGALRDGLAALALSGNLYLHKSTLDIRHSATAGEPLRTSWDLRLGCQPARIQCGIRLENIRGEIGLRGESDGKSYTCRGELDVESLTYRDFQFTEARGPVWIDNGRVLLGSWVGKRRQNPDGSPIEPPRAITAKLFGGTVKADAWVAPRHMPCYALTAEVLGADLGQFSTESLSGQQDLAGRVGLRLNLEGRRPSVNGLRGGGQMWLRDGDIYKLPVMIAILKILSMGELTTTAFSAADLSFQIVGDHIYLNPIEFNGDAISLVGQGEMDFRSNVDLAFSARLGRNKWQLPIISPLMGEASRQTMMIKVRGPLQNPQASRDVLPGVKEALRELEANLRASPGGSTTGSPPWTATGRTQPSIQPQPARR